MIDRLDWRRFLQPEVRIDGHQIYMLLVYPKSKKDDLSDKEMAILRELLKEL